MNKALKLIPLTSLFLIVPSTTALHNSIFKSGNIEKYDQNTITNSNEIGGGDFTCPINSTFFPSNGNSSTGMYRGITSINNGESDVFVITENDNAFVRMGNFNGSKTSKETRLSLYFYDNNNNVPQNIDNTTYLDVSFSYRLYISEIERLNINKDTLICQFQTRGSANGKSGNLYLRDLLINEEKDDSWHNVSFRINTDYSSLTSYVWFHFFYYDIKTEDFSHYFLDVDNLFCSTNSVNYLYDNGTFSSLKSGNNSFPTRENQDILYEKFFYKKYLGIAPSITRTPNGFCLLLDSDKNKATFSLRLNNKEETVYRISYSYWNRSRYVDPVLDFRIDNDKYLINLVSNKAFNSDNFSYLNIKNNENKCEFIGYFRINKTSNFDLDFIMNHSSLIDLDNLNISKVIETTCVSGDYDSFKNELDRTISILDNTINEYRVVDQKNIVNLLSKAKEINQYSSQKRMDESLYYLKEAINNSSLKPDLESLHTLIESCLNAIAGKNKNDFKKDTYIVFYNALNEAYSMNEDNSKVEVEEAYKNLLVAFNNLEEIK